MQPARPVAANGPEQFSNTPEAAREQREAGEGQSQQPQRRERDRHPAAVAQQERAVQVRDEPEEGRRCVGPEPLAAARIDQFGLPTGAVIKTRGRRAVAADANGIDADMARGDGVGELGDAHPRRQRGISDAIERRLKRQERAGRGDDQEQQRDGQRCDGMETAHQNVTLNALT